MEKRIFNEHDRYEREGREVTDLLIGHVRAWMEHHIERGYSLRELMGAAHGAIEIAGLDILATRDKRE